MGASYSHLNDAERATVMVVRDAGCGVRTMARRLSRAASTISREVRRQPYFATLPYEATRAADHAHWQSCQSRNRHKLRPGGALPGAGIRSNRLGAMP
jgi:IS30 family transposase